MSIGNEEQFDSVIIGAGIVGICCANALAQIEGQRILVLDRTGICDETSSGNAAGLAFTEVLPMAQKGIMRQLPRWLADPLGPLSIPPAYLPQLLPWLWRFWRAGNASNYQASLLAQAQLMKFGEPAWMDLLDQTNTREMLNETGCLQVYDSALSFNAALSGYRAAKEHGFDFEICNRDALLGYQPGLGEQFHHGAFVPQWNTVADPQILGKRIFECARQKGVMFENSTVERVEAHRDGALIWANGRAIKAKKLVIAAGAWSHIFAHQLGDEIPLEAERGYNTTLPVDALDLKLQVNFADHGFVITPLSTGIRVGGAVEFGGIKKPPNYARASAMLSKAKRFFPDLKTDGGRQWMGHRPSLPDSLPVIGRSSGSRDIIYAFGHGHLGLTQSAATAQLVCEMTMDKALSLDLTPYSPARF